MTLILLLALTFTWIDMSSNENGFIIEKSIGNCANGFEPYSYHGVDVQQVTDTAIGVPGDCYRVGAYNENGIAYSNTAQVPQCKRKGKNCK